MHHHSITEKIHTTVCPPSFMGSHCIFIWSVGASHTPGSLARWKTCPHKARNALEQHPGCAGCSALREQGRRRSREPAGGHGDVLPGSGPRSFTLPRAQPTAQQCNGRTGGRCLVLGGPGAAQQWWLCCCSPFPVLGLREWLCLCCTLSQSPPPRLGLY